MDTYEAPYEDRTFSIKLDRRKHEIIKVLAKGSPTGVHYPYVERGIGRVSILYNVTSDTRTALRDLAEQAGYAGNVTMLLEAIGQGVLILSPNPLLFEEPEVEEDTSDEIE